MSAEPETAGPSLSAPKAPLRVLFVDDDPILREFAAANLTGAGIEVDAAGGVDEAIAAATTHKPNLVLVSLEAPGYEALGLLTALREHSALAEIPVIAVVGREDIEGVDAAFEAGAAAFAVKPLNWRLVERQLRFTHRAAALAGPPQVGCDAATEQLVTLAREGVRFIAQAMALDPSLKTAAVPFAEAADVALETRTAGGGA